MDVKKDGAGFVSLLTQIYKALNRRTGEELLGMRFKPYMTLGYIRDHPGATQQELESALFMDANSVVLILNELEAARFSIRRRDPHDRRRHIVEITESGRKAIVRGWRTRSSATYRWKSGGRCASFSRRSWRTSTAKPGRNSPRLDHLGPKGCR
jgi:DNA-binding MarR family transcriptional regulator